MLRASIILPRHFLLSSVATEPARSGADGEAGTHTDTAVLRDSVVTGCLTVYRAISYIRVHLKAGGNICNCYRSHLQPMPEWSVPNGGCSLTDCPTPSG